MSDLLARLREAVLGRQHLPSDYGDMWADIERIVTEWERWVPVSERLPEKNGWYLVSIPKRWNHPEVAWYEPGMWEITEGFDWMPLPAPPEVTP